MEDGGGRLFVYDYGYVYEGKKAGLTIEEAWERIKGMGHKGWSSKVAGPAIGPYRQATEAGGFVFLSGQLALDEQGNLLNGTGAGDFSFTITVTFTKARRLG